MKLVALPPSQMPLPVAQTDGPAQVPVALSADGRHLLTTDDQYAGLYWTDIETSATLTITRSRNAGYEPSLAPDLSRVAYKLFRSVAGGEDFEQAAVVTDLRTGASSMLTDWHPVVGTPAFSASGRLAVAVGEDLMVQSAKGSRWQRHAIGHCSNMIAWSPDENTIAFTNADGRIALIDLGTAAVRVVTDGDQSCHAPRFSPDGRRLLARTINSRALVATLDGSAPVRDLGYGETPSWLDNNTVLYLEEGGTLKRRALSPDDAPEIKLGNPASRWWTITGDLVAGQQGSSITVQRIAGDKMAEVRSIGWLKQQDPPAPKPTHWPDAVAAEAIAGPARVEDHGNWIGIAGVPYVNQVWDVPDGYPGEWACNAVSAVMVLGFYGALEPHPIEVSRPETRTSPFGYYVTMPYSINGHTFDTTSPGPDKAPVAGGYGYIVREDWRDTKHYLRDYLRLHGLESETDWSPRWNKFTAEIDAGRPFVVLHSITLAGHYSTCVGHDKLRRTLVFNDPYGDKNTRYYPTIDGRRVRYDLPGYNNGYQNLRTVHCIVTARRD